MSWWKKYIGIPFESCGRTLDASDCYGLLRLIYANERGVDLPSLDAYENTLQRKRMNELIETQPALIGFDTVPLESVCPFDVLVLRNVGFNCHLGIVIDTQRMIHTEAGKGAVVEEYNRPHIKPRIREAYRYVQ